MQLGVPVLCARAGAMPEVLGDAPLWFNPRDVGDIKKALLRFAQLRPAAKASMLAAGRERAKSFSWAASARTLAEILKDSLASRHSSNRAGAA